MIFINHQNELSYKLFVIKSLRRKIISGQTRLTFSGQSYHEQERESYCALVIARSEHEAILVYNDKSLHQVQYWGVDSISDFTEILANYVYAIEFKSCTLSVQKYFKYNSNYIAAFDAFSNIGLQDDDSIESQNQSKVRLRTEVGTFEFFKNLALELECTDVIDLIESLRSGKIELITHERKAIRLNSHNLEDFTIENTDTVEWLQDLAYKRSNKLIAHLNDGNGNSLCKPNDSRKWHGINSARYICGSCRKKGAKK